MKNEELLETLEQIAGRLMNYEPLGTKRPALLSQIDELKRTYACTEVPGNLRFARQEGAGATDALPVFGKAQGCSGKNALLSRLLPRRPLRLHRANGQTADLLPHLFNYLHSVPRSFPHVARTRRFGIPARDLLCDEGP